MTEKKDAKFSYGRNFMKKKIVPELFLFDFKKSAGKNILALNYGAIFLNLPVGRNKQHKTRKESMVHDKTYLIKLILYLERIFKKMLEIKFHSDSQYSFLYFSWHFSSLIRFNMYWGVSLFYYYVMPVLNPPSNTS